MSSALCLGCVIELLSLNVKSATCEGTTFKYGLKPKDNKESLADFRFDMESFCHELQESANLLNGSGQSEFIGRVHKIGDVVFQGVVHASYADAALATAKELYRALNPADVDTPLSCVNLVKDWNRTARLVEMFSRDIGVLIVGLEGERIAVERMLREAKAAAPVEVPGYLDLIVDHATNTITRKGQRVTVDDWGKHEWPFVVAMINAGERGLTEHEAKQAFTGDKDGNAMNTAKSQIKSKLEPLALTIRRGQFKIEDDGTT